MLLLEVTELTGRRVGTLNLGPQSTRGMRRASLRAALTAAPEASAGDEDGLLFLCSELSNSIRSPKSYQRWLMVVPAPQGCDSSQQGLPGAGRTSECHRSPRN